MSILRDNQEALQVEKTLQNQQLQSLKDLVEANKTQFEKFRQSEAERAELIEKLESVVVEKGQENKVGVITSESSDEVKELFNKQIKKFNGVH